MGGKFDRFASLIQMHLALRKPRAPLYAIVPV